MQHIKMQYYEAMTNQVLKN